MSNNSDAEFFKGLGLVLLILLILGLLSVFCNSTPSRDVDSSIDTVVRNSNGHPSNKPR